MEQLVREIIAKHGRLRAPIETIGGSDDLYERGLSSHAAANVMLAIEDRLAVEFPDELMAKATFATIDTLTAAVQSLVRPAD